MKCTNVKNDADEKVHYDIMCGWIPNVVYDLGN